ncbi:unnamed protein product [Caenorhabditis angaria]|uniref:A4_EXTRA domain-containing protein n=1 Tax=Caenorhabditis angaria TaxID=860376 RepID=A0A9P1J3M8_9PELO|nr:unnamed protein product [Caenorhabditis angaria]
MTVGKLIIGLLIPIVVASSYIQDGKRHEKFVPLVAFSCGYRNQYMLENGSWKTDENRYASCFTGKMDILKYCKKAYPSLNITNIVEYSHEVSIDNWCREEGSPCHWTHSVRPYQCIDGEFHSEALQVPHDCQFSHVSAREKCSEHKYWKEEASKQCSAKKTSSNKPMIVRSFAVLEPCAIDMFTGVEFVCCPGEQLKKENKKANEDEDDDEEEDDMAYDDEEYSEESDEDKEESTTQDPYFKTANWTNEHEDFKNAEDRMNSKHRRKVDKVMKEWGELETRYAEMKTKDPKGAEHFKTSMNARFQKIVASLEEEHRKMKKEIEAVHEERVQGLINEKKRDATHEYRQALSSHLNKPNKNAVLDSLKAYIKAEEKDRIHTLNRYRHLVRTDQEEANVYRANVLHKLRYYDLRINGTLAMLHDFPDLEKYVAPVAISFWQDYRRENTPELSDAELKSLNSSEDAKSKKLVELYTEAYEKLHQSAKLDVKAPSTTEKPKDKDSVKVLPTDNSDSEDDDDDYYEDEDDEEVPRKKIAGGQPKTKVVEITPKKELLDVVPPKPIKTKVTSAQAEDDSSDDDDENDNDNTDNTSSSESDESDEDDKNIKELRVDIEPIIDEPQSFYKRNQFVQSEHKKGDFLNNSQFMFVVFVFSVICITMLMVVVRRRRAMRGFIEVDVYTPEERHVAGMQVNGYENPTYSFFDSKA